MAWFKTTKVVPQHGGTPISLLKHLSVFCSWKKKKEHNKETSLTSTMGWKRSSILTLAYTASLYFSLTRIHTEKDSKNTHTHSATTYFLTFT